MSVVRVRPKRKYRARIGASPVDLVLHGLNPGLTSVNYGLAAAFYYNASPDTVRFTDGFWIDESLDPETRRKYERYVRDMKRYFKEFVEGELTIGDLVRKIDDLFVKESGYSPNIMMEYIGGDYPFLKMLVTY